MQKIILAYNFTPERLQALKLICMMLRTQLRAVTREEYEQVLDHADDLGFTTMFWQEGGAVDESFTPAFDTTGVLTSAK